MLKEMQGLDYIKIDYSVLNTCHFKHLEIVALYFSDLCVCPDFTI